MEGSAPAESLVPRIYDVITSPGEWQGVLDELADFMGALAANVFLGDAVHGEVARAWLSSSVSDLFDREENLRLMASEQDLFRFMPQMESGDEIVTESELLQAYNRAGRPHLELTQLREWLKRDYGICNRAGAALGKKPNYFDFIAFHFGDAGEPPSRQSLKKGHRLIPHLAKAVELSRPFLLLESRFGAVLDVIDRFRLGVIIMTEERQVWLYNESARRVLEDGDSLKLRADGKLTAVSEDNRRDVEAALHEILDETGEGVKSRRFSLARRGAGDPYVVDLSLLNNRESGRPGQGRSVLMVIVDPDRSALVNLAHLGDLFKLTQVESRVCDLVVRGHTTKEIAEIRNVSPETVVTQVKSLFSKTNSRRRGDLIHLAHSVNIPVDPPDGDS